MDQKRILVVEDDKTLQYLMRLLANRNGVDADVVSCGQAALEAVQNGEDYSIIFMDWRMPGMDGLECTRRIRAFEKAGGRRVPIVAITASADDGDKRDCLESGMDDFMCKPFAPEQFRATLDRWLSDMGDEPIGQSSVGC